MPRGGKRNTDNEPRRENPGDSEKVFESRKVIELRLRIELAKMQAEENERQRAHERKMWSLHTLRPEKVVTSNGDEWGPETQMWSLHTQRPENVTTSNGDGWGPETQMWSLRAQRPTEEIKEGYERCYCGVDNSGGMENSRDRPENKTPGGCGEICDNKQKRRTSTWGCYACGGDHLVKECPSPGKSKGNGLQGTGDRATQQFDGNKGRQSELTRVQRIRVETREPAVGIRSKELEGAGTSVCITARVGAEYFVLNDSKEVEKPPEFFTRHRQNVKRVRVQTAEGQELNGSVDSGCELSVIHSDYVDPVRVEHRGCVMLQPAFGEVRKAELVERDRCLKTDVNTIRPNGRLQIAAPAELHEPLLLTKQDFERLERRAHRYDNHSDYVSASGDIADQERAEEANNDISAENSGSHSCMELRVAMEEQGYQPDGTGSKLAVFRANLLAQDVEKSSEVAKDEFGRPIAEEILGAVQEENKRFKEALGINQYFAEGSSLDTGREAKETTAKEKVKKKYEVFPEPVSVPNTSSLEGGQASPDSSKGTKTKKRKHARPGSASPRSKQKRGKKRPRRKIKSGFIVRRLSQAAKNSPPVMSNVVRTKKASSPRNGDNTVWPENAARMRDFGRNFPTLEMMSRTSPAYRMRTGSAVAFPRTRKCRSERDTWRWNFVPEERKFQSGRGM